MTDWVYEEEFDLRDAFRWSPDGSKIAYWRFGMTGPGTHFLVNDTDSLYPQNTPIQNPKVRTRNSGVGPRVHNPHRGPPPWLQFSHGHHEHHLPPLQVA